MAVWHGYGIAIPPWHGVVSIVTVWYTYGNHGGTLARPLAASLYTDSDGRLFKDGSFTQLVITTLPRDFDKLK